MVSKAFDRSRSSWNETSLSLIRLKRSPAGLRAPLWPFEGAGLSEAEPEPKALPRAFFRSGWTLASLAAATSADETSSEALRLVEVTVVWTIVVVVEVVATGAARRETDSQSMKVRPESVTQRPGAPSASDSDDELLEDESLLDDEAAFLATATTLLVFLSSASDSLDDELLLLLLLDDDEEEELEDDEAFLPAFLGVDLTGEAAFLAAMTGMASASESDDSEDDEDEDELLDEEEEEEDESLDESAAAVAAGAEADLRVIKSGR